MGAHTPGPWVVRSPHNDSRALDVYPAANPHLKLHHGYWGGEADARLIAAAPDLLEALKAVLPFAESRAEDLSEIDAEHGVSESSIKAWRGIEAARAAIAKAEGK